MPTIVKKSIGAGKDFANFGDFLPWLKTQKLVTNDQMVIAEVHDNLPMYNGLGWNYNFETAESDFTHYCLIRPAPGLGINDITPDGTPQHYAGGGITLSVTIPATSNWMGTFRHGVVLEGFRIFVTGGVDDDVTVRSAFMLAGNPANRPSQIRQCRFLSEAVGSKCRVFTSGEYTYAGTVADCIFIHTAGKALSIALNYKAVVERNVFLRTGTAAGNPATTGIDLSLKDNIFLGCGPTPALGLPASANAKIANNYTDTAMTTPYPSGFTVMTTEQLARDVATDLRLPAGSSLIGKGSPAAVNTFGMFGKYRGQVPDVGPFQVTAQPLPAPPTGTITGTTIVNQTVTVTGTVEGDPFGGSVTLVKTDGTVVASKAAVMKTATTWEAVFANIDGGNYKSPQAIFSNYGGDGAAATGGAPFFIETPVIPTAVIQKQYVVGDTVTFFGTVENVPLSAKISAAVSGTPDGAVEIANATTVYFDTVTKKFVAYLYGVTPGNYLAPDILFTNNAGTSARATGGAAFTVVKTPTPVESGVNVQMIGKGQTHANIKAFQTWMSARTNVPAGEVIHAYVTNYIHASDLSSLSLAPNGTALVVIKPAPGLGMLDRHAGEALNWYDDGMEIMLKPGNSFTVKNGITFQGFRIKAMDVGSTATGTTCCYMTANNSSQAQFFPGPFKGNFFLNELSDEANYIFSNGEYNASSYVTDNLFVQEKGKAKFFLVNSAYVVRNTFVRRGGALGTLAGRHGASYDSGEISDNIFIGCGPAPVTVDSTKLKMRANLTDTALTTQWAGWTVSTEAAIVQTAGSNYKPKAGGPAIGKASDSAISTDDMTGRNRGPAPDIGAWQLNSYVPVPKGQITGQTLDGTKLRLSGTYSEAPLSGFASVAIGTNPGKASALPEKALIINEDGTWYVEWTQLTPGNYAAPVVYMTNAGGKSANFLGGVVFSVVTIAGNPRAADLDSTAPVGIPPEIKLTSSKVSGNKATISGTVDLKNDPTGKVEVFIDPLPSGPTVGPVQIPTDNGVWNYIAAVSTVRATIRVMATAYGIPVLTSFDVTLVKATGNMAMPSK